MNITDPNIWVAIAAGAQAVVTLLLLIVTGYYAVQAHHTVDEMRKARKQSNDDQEAARKEQIESVRILLQHEIDQNYSAARDFWQNVTTGKLPLPGTDRNAHSLLWKAAQRMISVPAPSFSYIARNSLLAQLPIALQPEKIRELGIFYTKLDSIVDIYRSLEALYSEGYWDPNVKVPFGEGAIMREEFNNNAPGLASKCQAIIDSLEKPSIP